MTGVRDGRWYTGRTCSRCRPEARDHGIGRRLKLYQRSLVAELGVTRILWTFDPLVSRNAHLNLNALGARVTDYVPDMYGVGHRKRAARARSARTGSSWLGGQRGRREAGTNNTSGGGGAGAALGVNAMPGADSSVRTEALSWRFRATYRS